MDSAYPDPEREILSDYRGARLQLNFEPRQPHRAWRATTALHYKLGRGGALVAPTPPTPG